MIRALRHQVHSEYMARTHPEYAIEYTDTPFAAPKYDYDDQEKAFIRDLVTFGTRVAHGMLIQVRSWRNVAESREAGSESGAGRHAWIQGITNLLFGGGGEQSGHCFKFIHNSRRVILCTNITNVIFGWCKDHSLTPLEWEKRILIPVISEAVEELLFCYANQIRKILLTSKTHPNNVPEFAEVLRKRFKQGVIQRINEAIDEEQSEDHCEPKMEFNSSLVVSAILGKSGFSKTVRNRIDSTVRRSNLHMGGKTIWNPSSVLDKAGVKKGDVFYTWNGNCGRPMKYGYRTLSEKESPDGYNCLPPKNGEFISILLKLIFHRNFEKLLLPRGYLRKSITRRLRSDKPLDEPKEDKFRYPIFFNFKDVPGPYMADMFKSVRRRLDNKGDSIPPLDAAFKTLAVLDRAEYINWEIYERSKPHEKDRMEYAYQDRPTPIGYGFNTSAPHMHAIVTALAAVKVKKGATVLDVGCGSGYLTAAFALLVGPYGKVYGVDNNAGLVALAKGNILKDKEILLKHDVVTIVGADGRYGYEAGAPYDIIHIGGGIPAIHFKLWDQLKEGGRIISVIGSAVKESQVLTIIDKEGGGGDYVEKQIFRVRFAQLIPPDQDTEKIFQDLNGLKHELAAVKGEFKEMKSIMVKQQKGD